METMILNEIFAEIEKAKQKHPDFPADPEGGASIITEEYLELIRAINDKESKARIKEEAYHVIVTAYRLIENLDGGKIMNWQVKENGEVVNEN